MNGATAQKLIARRVFIVGAPRSGTTLLQGILSAHPRIYSLPETFFFAKVMSRTWLKRNLLWPSIKVRRHFARFVKELGREDLLPMARIGILQRKYYIPFVQVMDRLTLDAGKDIWIEKTPWHLYCIDEIKRCIPDALFIHIAREGKDVVASLFNATRKYPQEWASLGGWRYRNWKGYTLEECVTKWNRDMAISKRYLGRKDHILIRYEDLVSETKREILRLAGLLNIDFHENMMNPGMVYGDIAKPSEEWKARNAEMISKKESLFNDIFTPEQKDWIVNHLDPYQLS